MARFLKVFAIVRHLWRRRRNRCPQQLCEHCLRSRAEAAKIVCGCAFGMAARQEMYPHLVRDL